MENTGKEIIALILKELGVKAPTFANSIGVKYQRILDIQNRKTKKVSSAVADAIIEKYPQFNKVWILTGEGDMLKSTETNLPEKYPIDSEVGVPFYDINVTASITESFNDIKEKPSYKINVPFLNDCTAAFPVYGDSMLPAYRPGDTVIVKEITNRDSLLWGEVYLVITNANCDNMRTIKRVYISEDRQNYILRATNPEFAGDTIVPCNDVIGLFLVKGKISRTQL